jgi:hypothetical protein
MKLAVEYGDGRTEQLTISPLAFIGWEKWSGRKMTDLSSDGGGVGMGDLARLAWEQAKLSGLTSDDYEPWVATLADVEGVDDTDPTGGKGPSDGP